MGASHGVLVRVMFGGVAMLSRLVHAADMAGRCGSGLAEECGRSVEAAGG